MEPEPSEPEVKEARRLSEAMLIVVAVMVLLILVAIYWGACGEDRASGATRQISPPRDAPGPDGAPGVAQPPAVE
jgi:hypothetical protein